MKYANSAWVSTMSRDSFMSPSMLSAKSNLVAIPRLAEDNLQQVAHAGADDGRRVSAGSRSWYAKIAFLILA